MSVKIADPYLFWDAKVLTLQRTSIYTNTHRSGYMLEVQTTAKTTDGLTYNMTVEIQAIK